MSEPTRAPAGDVSEVMGLFDGPSGLAHAIRARQRIAISTVHSWKQVGRIPHWWMPQVRQAAIDKGVTLPAWCHAGEDTTQAAPAANDRAPASAAA